MWRYTLPLFGLLLLGVVFFLGLGRNAGELPSPLIGKPAPAFSLPTLGESARMFTEQDLRGRPSLVNVWGTWCPQCRTEHPLLMQIAEAGVAVYGLNWKDDDALAKQWLARFGDPYILTGADRDGLVAIDWGVYGAPETFVVDANGIVRYKHIGPITPEVWREELLPVLEEAAAVMEPGDAAAARLEVPTP